MARQSCSERRFNKAKKNPIEAANPKLVFGSGTSVATEEEFLTPEKAEGSRSPFLSRLTWDSEPQ